MPVMNHEPRPAAPLRVCGLPIESVRVEEAAAAMVGYCRSPERAASSRPRYSTSVNGQVLSLCATRPDVLAAFAAADEIHCDGQPLVLLSRRIGSRPLPERVATTDLFPAVAGRAAERGVTFYLYGATPDSNRKAVENVRAAYPGLRIVGAAHGYGSAQDRAATVRDIARLKPDILWVALGAPREQLFVLEYREALAGVGIIKTSGGLFDFLAEEKARAPRWMQRAGLEWLFRLGLEPRRLFWRYAVTNPHAVALMVASLLRQGRADRLSRARA